MDNQELRAEIQKQSWQKAIEDWNAEKRSFLKLTPEEKVSEKRNSFNFFWLTQFKKEATENDWEEFKKRALIFFKNPKTSGRIYPNTETYFGIKVEEIHRFIARTLQTDIGEQKYYGIAPKL